MKCERCKGLVVVEEFRGGDSTSGAWLYDGWRCVNCGNVITAAFARVRQTSGCRKRRDSMLARESLGFRCGDGS